MDQTIAGSLSGSSGSTVVWAAPATSAWQYKPSGWEMSYGGSLLKTFGDEATMDLYEYSVVYTGDEDYKGAKVLIAPTAVLSFDEAGVRMIAARAIPLEYDDRLDDITIYVRLWQV